MNQFKAAHGKDFYPLSHPQKRIWYIEEFYPDTSLHNIGGVSKIYGKINLNMLEKALNIFIQSNDGIRLRFVREDGEIKQYCSDYRKTMIDFFNFSPATDPEGEFNAWALKEMRRPFKLIESALYYFAIYKIADNNMGFLGKFHHLIADGWSIKILTDQVYDIYRRLSNGEEIGANPRHSYREYLDHERNYLNSERFIKNRAFWKAKFTDIPAPVFDTDPQNIAGERVTFRLENDISRKIKDFCDRYRYSLNTFFIMVFLVYLHKVTQRNDLTIGSFVLNRSGDKGKKIFGMFTSTMPFRFKIDGGCAVSQTISQINEDLRKFYFHQKYPYDLLVQDLELKKKGYDDLFQVAVNYYNTRIHNEADGFLVETEELYNGNQLYLLQLIIKEWGNQNDLTVEIDYKLADFTSEQINQMFGCLINLIGQILKDDSREIAKLTVLPESERNRLIYRFNSSQNEYPRDKTIHQLFEAQVAQTPERIAIRFEEEQLTYCRLNQKANQLARVLRAKGVTRDTIVGLMATHSIEAVTGMLGIIKAGGAYLPIDPEYPADRIEYMLADCSCPILLTNCAARNSFNYDGTVLFLSDAALYGENGADPVSVNRPEDLVYVIYTSGSTGKPKGVMIEHRGLVNYIWWARKMYVKDQNDDFALYSSLSFDLTVTSIFTPLICGNKIIVYRDDGREYVLFRIIKEDLARVVKLTPSHLALLADRDHGSSGVRRFIVGGEDLKTSLAARIQKSFGGKIEIYNEYGPTETVVGCMIHRFDDRNDAGISVPIGVPADNVRIYILDRDLNPLPEGYTGELYISGDGVARGYLNRPALTAERFIANPFIRGERMYKTGDLARFLANGKIEYVGRADQQVKIRGYRIELGEIEKHLLGCHLVTNAVVIDGQKADGEKYLCAYIVNSDAAGNGPRLIPEIKKQLRKYLPEYMVPAYFVVLDEIPLTQNGKLDRSRLPEPLPEEAGEAEAEYVVPVNAMEKMLLEVVGETLGTPGIGMASNFYYYGGDSIKAIQIAAKLNDLGLKLKARDILSHPVISEMAACLEYEKNRIDQSPRAGSFNPTPIYRWFFSRNFTIENHYNQSVILDLKADTTVEYWRLILTALVKHHDSLRLNYNRVTGELSYYNDLADQDITVQYYDLKACPPAERNQRMKQLSAEFKAGFDIENGVIIKAAIFDLGDWGQKVLLTAHHMAVDGVSWRILLEDIYRIYDQIKMGRDVVLPLKTHSLKEWSARLKEYEKTVAINESVFWNQILKSDFKFPIDFDLGEDLLANCDTLGFQLTAEETGQLFRSAGDPSGIRPSDLLITALARTVCDFTGKQELLLELEGHGREELFDDLDISRTVGWFTCLYPIALRISGTEIPEQLKAIKEQLDNVPNHGIGYGLLKSTPGMEPAAEKKLIRFNFLGDFNAISENEYFRCAYHEAESDSSLSNYLTALFEINAMIAAGELRINLTYSKNKFKETTMKDFIHKFEAQLRTVRGQIDSLIPSGFELVQLSEEDLASILI